MKNIFLQINDIRNHGLPLVLATVVSTSGSTPQKPGSTALFGPGGLIAGTVGGGVTEGKVQQLASEAALSKKSGLYHFDLANDISNKYEAICGGQISILIDAVPEQSHTVFEDMRRSLAGQIPGVLVTSITGKDDNELNLCRYWVSGHSSLALPESDTGMVVADIQKLILEKNPAAFSQINASKPGDESISAFFLQPFFPPENLIIAGAGHIGRALAQLGSFLDFEVTVIDDRTEYANRENIPAADHIVVCDIGKAMIDLAPGENTYVVIVTRGHKDDAAALKPCIVKDLTYLGMIGSRNKIAAMRQDFLDNGWATEEQWNMIHAPVGLPIRSQTVEEIAVSIAAELVLVRNGR